MKKNILSFLFLLFFFSFSYAQTPKLVKLKATPKTTKDSVRYVDAQTEELHKLKASLKTIKDSSKYVDALNRIATLICFSEVDSTFYFADRAKKIADRLGYEKGQADALNNLGVFHIIKGNFNLALRYCQKANLIFKEIKESEAFLGSLMNIGSVYASQGKKKQAIERLDAALFQGEKLKKDSLVAIVIINYLTVYPNRFNEEQKNKYLNKANKIAIKYKNVGIRLIINSIKANDLIAQNKKQEGLALLRQSLDTALNSKLYYLSMDMLMRLGDHLDKTDTSLTAFYYKKALAIAGQNNYSSWREIILSRLFNFYTNQNNTASSVIYGRQLISLYAEKRLKDNLTGVDYLDYALKEEQVASLAERSRLQLVLLSMAAAVCLMVVITLIVIRKALKKTKRLNKVVVAQNDQMKKALEALEESQRDNTNLLKIVAHDLRGPVAGIHSLAASMIEEANRSESDQEMLLLIKNSSSDSLELVNNLLQLQFKSEAINKASVDLLNMLSHCVLLLKPNAEAKAQRINLNVNPFTLLANREKLWRVFSNLITNAIKFSPRNTTIEVKTEEVNDHVRISVTDEGIGIPAHLENQIFNMFTDAKRQGTGGEESFGLGLAICKQIVSAHNGKIWFERRAEKGTTFFVELPY